MDLLSGELRDGRGETEKEKENEMAPSCGDELTAIAADSAVKLRNPSTSAGTSTTSFIPPSMEFFQGTWRVTHSTLPMWKSSRDVTITYTVLDDPSGTIDDLVQYYSLKSEKLKTVHGVDSPDDQVPAKYTWRGRGWLRVASSKWEVLGFGDDEGGWMVTYFAKTLFTPAGLDIYARTKDGISTDLLSKLRTEMNKMQDPDVQTMTDQIFEIQHTQ